MLHNGRRGAQARRASRRRLEGRVSTHAPTKQYGRHCSRAREATDRLRSTFKTLDRIPLA